jgi:AraC-like DNA-binding protein
MSLALDTAWVEPQERFRLWRDTVAELFVRLDATTDTPDTFEMTVDRSVIGSVMHAKNTSNRQQLHRRAFDPDDAREDVLVFVRADRMTTEAIQDGSALSAHEGEIAVVDASREYRLRMVDGTAQTVLQVSRDDIRERAGKLSLFKACVIPADHPLIRFAFAYIANVISSIDELTPAQISTHSDRAVDLLVMGVCEVFGKAPSDPRVRRFADLYRVKSCINAQLRTPSLSVSDVASALDMTIEHVVTLLRAEDLTFRAYVLEKRLDQCARDFSTPALMHRMVSEIAYSWGFDDLSSFSRAFKNRFSASPREWREAKLAEGVSSGARGSLHQASR